MKRRDWMLMAGGGLLGGCAPSGGGSTGVSRWSRSSLEKIDTQIRYRGCKGWGAWENGVLRKSWRTHSRGPALSITKAIAGMACAKAIQEGWLSVNELAVNTLGEWRGVSGKDQITVLMLLQMTAGFDEGGRALYRSGLSDKGRVALGLPMREAPGTQFRYGPACWEVLGELLHRKASARGETLETLLQRSVMTPVGLSCPKWRADRKGRYYLSTGTELNVTGLGRLGRTIAGLMTGQDMAGISASAYRSVIRPSSANPMFGGGVWRNRRGARGVGIDVEEVLDPPRSPSFWKSACMSRYQPTSMVALIGSSGQRVFIWPEHGRVVARLGRSGSWRDQAFLKVV